MSGEKSEDPLETTNDKKQRIVNIISSVIEKVGQNQQVSLNSVLAEMRDLLLLIEETRSELGRAVPSDIKIKDIPGATDELDAIVAATSEATSVIMDSCDVIMGKASVVEGENGEAIVSEVMKIYEACSFQDITGQRVSKVVKTFCDIEEKVDRLVSALGVEAVPLDGDESPADDEALMSGPQLPDQSLSQDDIDKLLAELDAAE